MQLTPQDRYDLLFLIQFRQEVSAVSSQMVDKAQAVLHDSKDADAAKKILNRARKLRKQLKAAEDKAAELWHAK